MLHRQKKKRNVFIKLATVQFGLGSSLSPVVLRHGTAIKGYGEMCYTWLGKRWNGVFREGQYTRLLLHALCDYMPYRERLHYAPWEDRFCFSCGRDEGEEHLDGDICVKCHDLLVQELIEPFEKLNLAEDNPITRLSSSSRNFAKSIRSWLFLLWKRFTNRHKINLSYFARPWRSQTRFTKTWAFSSQHTRCSVAFRAVLAPLWQCYRVRTFLRVCARILSVNLVVPLRALGRLA